MRIMEERVAQQNPFTSHSAAIVANEAIRKELRCDIAEFINRGGKITEYSSRGDVIVEPVIVPVTDNKKRLRIRTGHKDLSPITMIPYKNRNTTRSPHGQNIRKYKAKGAEYYWVQVGAVELGKGERWDLATAIRIRDKVRAENKMPPAEY